MTIEWQLELSDLKWYPHFDKVLSLNEVRAIVTDPQRVAANAFFPFLRYVKSWKPYRPNNEPAKERLIRYASRRDAYIFAYYRHLLAQKYEIELRRLGIDDCPIAYRKISRSDTNSSGKCNINFAKDFFDHILLMEKCCVVALDIKSYFESLDHTRLYDLWCRMIEVTQLPPDHEAVFRAITKYAVADRDQVYERLGFIGSKLKNGRKVKGYLVPYKEMPKQLCTPKEFRAKIAGGDPSFSKLIKQNDENYGIPQGAPISDLLANLYLIDFDKSIYDYVRPLGGYYRRYSDDILIILPGDNTVGLAAYNYATDQIANFGSEVRFKSQKTSIVTFAPDDQGSLTFKRELGEQGRNGLEYLGFRFDGRRVYLRDSTLSGFYRKITYSLRHEVRAFVARYPGKSKEFLLDKFDLEGFVKRFGRIEDFDPDSDAEDWTFWTYARRAAQDFGSRGKPIYKQLRGHRDLIVKRVHKEFDAALT